LIFEVEFEVEVEVEFEFEFEVLKKNYCLTKKGSITNIAIEPFLYLLGLINPP